MSESVWSMHADELLRRLASDAPTPGSGVAAAAAGALGIALVLKALAITDDDGCAGLRTRGAALLERVVAAADRDVDALAAALDAEGDAAQPAIAGAADVPLDLAAALLEGLALAREAEPLVKATLVSDVFAGADLLRGAARAAIRAADLNVALLEERDAAAAAPLRQRIDALLHELHSVPSVE